MGVAEQFISGARQAFAAAGNALTSVTYHATPATGSDSYTPSTGTSSVTATEITVDVLFARFKGREIDGDRIRVSDLKVIIEAAALVDSSGAAVTPQLTDWIEDPDGNRWEVKQDLSPKAVDAIHVLQVRAPS